MNNNHEVVDELGDLVRYIANNTLKTRVLGSYNCLSTASDTLCDVAAVLSSQIRELDTVFLSNTDPEFLHAIACQVLSICDNQFIEELSQQAIPIPEKYHASVITNSIDTTTSSPIMADALVAAKRHDIILNWLYTTTGETPFLITSPTVVSILQTMANREHTSYGYSVATVDDWSGPSGVDYVGNTILSEKIAVPLYMSVFARSSIAGTVRGFGEESMFTTVLIEEPTFD